MASYCNILWFAFLFFAQSLCAQSFNAVPNHDFSEGEEGALPKGWTQVSDRPAIAPHFSKESENGRSYLLMKGTGNPAAVGYIKAKTDIVPGKTYEFKVLFDKTANLNPQRNLLFQCKGSGNHDGIMDFYKLDNGLTEGRTKVFFPENSNSEVELRLYYRLLSQGAAKIFDVSLTATEPDAPRWVRVACTSGNFGPAEAVSVIEQAAADQADLVLLPEYLNYSNGAETLDGTTCTMLAEMALKHKIFIAAGIIRHDENSGNKFNTGVLYDRAGKLVGTYDKIHPYSPEVNDQGFTPGNKVQVFDTELGKIAFMICYDSWFTDVAELAALRGAELILFPNAGYYKSLMHARAADNRVRIAISSLYHPFGIFDTVGRDVQNPEKDSTTGVGGHTFDNVKVLKVGNIEVLVASLDLNCSPSPHYNGGTMMEAPGGRRNRDEQIYYLEDDIKREKERWWK